MNKINRKHHFESDRQAYTAWITVDVDMNVVYRPKELPELSKLPDCDIPAIIIKNDDNPDKSFYIGVFGSGIWVDGDSGSFEAEEYQLSTISFYERINTLTFYLCEDAYAHLDEDEYEDEDDEYEAIEIPCDKRLAAFILKYWNIDVAVERSFEKNNEFMDDMNTIKEFTIED